MKIKGWFIGGPKNSEVIALHHEDVEPLIKALCEMHGFDNDDYTATEVEVDL